MLLIILICRFIVASTSVETNGASDTYVCGASVCVTRMSDNSMANNSVFETKKEALI